MSTPSVTAAPRNSFFSGRKMWFWVAVGLGLITTTLLVILLQSLTATTTYYVVNKEIPARTLITEADLEPIVTSAGGEPPAALSLADVNTGTVYSLYKLNSGDILTLSNAGSLAPLTVGLPSDYVVASFTASPNLSAGGNIKRGDYIDVFYIGDGEDGQSVKLLLQRVLVIDATTDLEGATPDTGEGTSTDPNSVTSTYRSGVPSLYTVGVSQEDAAKLALASQFTIYLTLSSADSVENGATDKDLSFFISDLFGLTAGDAGKGTNNTFEPVEGDSGTNEGTPTPEETEEPAPEETPTEDGGGEEVDLGDVDLGDPIEETTP